MLSLAVLLPVVPIILIRFDIYIAGKVCKSEPNNVGQKSKISSLNTTGINRYYTHAILLHLQSISKPCNLFRDLICEQADAH